MQAVGFSEYGGPEVLRFVEVPRPAPEPRDLLVRVWVWAVSVKLTRTA
jgi:NADPH:quinone reductase-like Zn-dependent oxidoreductase